MSSVGIGGLAAALTLAMLSKSERKGRILTTASLLLPVALDLVRELGPLPVVAVVPRRSRVQQPGVPGEPEFSDSEHRAGRIARRIVGIYMFAFVGLAPLGSLLMGAVG